MISQITWLTWAARIGSSTLAPSGFPSRSVTEMVTLCTPSLSVDASSSLVVVELASRSIRSGTVMSMGGLEVALMRTDTGSSSPLVIVTENGPELLERMTRRGPDTEIESSCCRTHPVVLTVATRERTAFSRAA